MMQHDLQTRREDPGPAWLVSAQVALALLAAAVIVFPWDQAVSGMMSGFPLRHTFFGRVVRLTGKFDVVLVLMLLICWATDDRRTLWRFILAAVASSFVVLLTKVIVGRVRPDGNPHSFPSGDTSIAFVWAVVLAARYRWLAVAAFLTAALVGTLRVAGGRHFPSDVFAGAAVGLACGSLAVHSVRRFVPRWTAWLTAARRSGWVVAGVFVVYVLVKALNKPHILVLAAIAVVAVGPALLSGRQHGRHDGLHGTDAADPIEDPRDADGSP